MGSAASVSGRSSTPRPANRGKASAAQRLDALNRMAGTLTHDLNNLLGVILGANERLADELGEGSEQQALARLALEAAERGAELLRRSLSLAQGGAPARDTTDAPAVLKTVGRMARQALAPKVGLTVTGLRQPLRCNGDRTGLEMALLNLCLNAGQAMPGGGEVVIGARGLCLGVLETRRLGVAPGAFAVFTVRDTGPGMSPRLLARATDPLFTTKPTGTGLGLSAVIDFAASAGGAFALQSREGQGTTATLYLPIAGPANITAAAA